MSSTTANNAQFMSSGIPTANPVYMVDNAGNPVSFSAKQGSVSLYGSNPATTGIATDISIQFGPQGTTQVNHVLIANNTTISINYELDAATTLGSDILAAGQKILFDVQVLAVHLQATSSQNVNGTSAGNIVVRGWL